MSDENLIGAGPCPGCRVPYGHKHTEGCQWIGHVDGSYTRLVPDHHRPNFSVSVNTALADEPAPMDNEGLTDSGAVSVVQDFSNQFIPGARTYEVAGTEPADNTGALYESAGIGHHAFVTVSAASIGATNTGNGCDDVTAPAALLADGTLNVDAVGIYQFDGPDAIEAQRAGEDLPQAGIWEEPEGDIVVKGFAPLDEEPTCVSDCLPVWTDADEPAQADSFEAMAEDAGATASKVMFDKLLEARERQKELYEELERMRERIGMQEASNNVLREDREMFRSQLGESEIKLAIADEQARFLLDVLGRQFNRIAGLRMYQGDLNVQGGAMMIEAEVTAVQNELGRIRARFGMEQEQ